MAVNNDKFDDLMRSMLENALEEVPEGIWDSIESRLPEKRRVKLFPLLLKAALPVAAAVALAVVFATRDYSGKSELVSPIAEAGAISLITDSPASVAIADIPAPASLTLSHKPASDAPESATAIKPESATATEPEPATAIDPESETVTESETGPANGTAPAVSAEPATEETGSDTAAATEKEWESFLAEADDFDVRRSPRFAVVLSGNAISNTNSSVSRNSDMAMAFAPSKNVELKDRISESSTSSYGIPFNVGIGTKIEFTPRWSLGVGLNYSRLTRTFDGTYFQVVEDSYKQTVISNIKNRQYYIGIPVNAYFNILKGDFINFYTYAGGTVEKCISDRYVMSIQDGRKVHTEKVKGFQWSANIGIGLEFVIADQFGLYIDPSLRYYFENSSQPKSIRTVQPLMFGLEAGLRIHL